MTRRQKPDPVASRIFPLRGFGRLRINGPKTTPKGTSAAAQKRRRLSPARWSAEI